LYITNITKGFIFRSSHSILCFLDGDWKCIFMTLKPCLNSGK